MKTTIKIAVILLSLFMVFQFVRVNAASRGIIPIHVVFSAKAYWDGQTKSCLPREKGGCCHIWMDQPIGTGQIIGNLEINPEGSLVFTVSKTNGMQAETFKQYFEGGKFLLDGSLTFSAEVLSKLGLKSDFTISAGIFPCTFKGDTIIIPLK